MQQSAGSCHVWIDKLTTSTSSLKLGDPLDEDTDVGAIINENQFSKVCRYVEDGLATRFSIDYGRLAPKDGTVKQRVLCSPNYIR